MAFFKFNKKFSKELNYLFKNGIFCDCIFKLKHLIHKNLTNTIIDLKTQFT